MIDTSTNKLLRQIFESELSTNGVKIGNNKKVIMTPKSSVRVCKNKLISISCSFTLPHLSFVFSSEISCKWGEFLKMISAHLQIFHFYTENNILDYKTLVLKDICWWSTLGHSRHCDTGVTVVTELLTWHHDFSLFSVIRAGPD